MKLRNQAGETIKAGCIVINSQGQILLVGNKNGTSWAFPKGHAERGETLKEVALRETFEETGYRVELIRQLADIFYTIEKTGELVRVGMFLAKPVEIAGYPEEKIQWATLAEAKKVLHPNLVTYLEEIDLVP